jgi:hypothetical protein
MIKNPSISAGFSVFCVTMENDLGNRRSIRLSYGGIGRIPRVLRVCGQCGTRGTRDGTRFLSAQTTAQSVRGTFARGAHITIQESI